MEEIKVFCESCDSKGVVHKKECPKRKVKENAQTSATDVNGIDESSVATEVRTTQVYAEKMAPEAIRHPDIRAGVCEFHGQSYKVCDHYRGVDIYCTYCGRSDIVPSRSLKIYSLKEKPHELIIVCDEFNCVDTHRKRFTKK